MQGGKLKTRHEIRIGALFRDAPEPDAAHDRRPRTGAWKESEHNKAFYQLPASIWRRGMRSWSLMRGVVDLAGVRLISRCGRTRKTPGAGACGGDETQGAGRALILAASGLASVFSTFFSALCSACVPPSSFFSVLSVFSPGLHFRFGVSLGGRAAAAAGGRRGGGFGFRVWRRRRQSPGRRTRQTHQRSGIGQVLAFMAAILYLSHSGFGFAPEVFGIAALSQLMSEDYAAPERVCERWVPEQLRVHVRLEKPFSPPSSIPVSGPPDGDPREAEKTTLPC